MTEVEIDGQTYRIGRLNAIKQFHIARRLAPIISALSKNGAESSQADFIGSLTTALAKVSDEDTDFILFTCLDVVQRKVGPAWAPVKVKGQLALMFEDIDLAAMMELTVRVIEENLGGFLHGDRPTSIPEAPTSHSS